MASENKEMYNYQLETRNSEEENKDNQSETIILGLNVHCPACEEKILKSIRGFDGVEGIEIDAKNNKVTIKGKNGDPIKIAKRIKNKTGKHVEYIFPKNPKKEEIKKKGDQNKKEPPVVEVVLKIYLYCEACVKDIKKTIHNMPGVQTVQADLEKNLVTVKGAIEPEKLVKFVKKKTGKFAEIVKKENKEEEKQDDDDGKNKKQGGDQIYGNYPPGLVYAPQLFSDENPNACSIM